jgi:hypothetical protein
VVGHVQQDDQLALVTRLLNVDEELLLSTTQRETTVGVAM